MALQGLFTAHVTGNFVTLGAILVQGTSCVVAKLLALPVFCAVIVLTRSATASMHQMSRRALPAVTMSNLALLALGASLAIRFAVPPLLALVTTVDALVSSET